jgi:hypothetical protein
MCWQTEQRPSFEKICQLLVDELKESLDVYDEGELSSAGTPEDQ